jgi:hypothetical protein
VIFPHSIEGVHQKGKVLFFMSKLDLTEKRFGNLTVICRGDKTKHGTYRWNCKCDCGNLVSIPTNDLRSGHTRSCGCLKKSKNTVQKACLTRRIRYGINKKQASTLRNMETDDFTLRESKCAKL